MQRTTLRGLIFDLDGTLVIQELDFEAIRREIGLTGGTPLLEALADMEGAAAARAWEILRDHERRAAESARPHAGVVEFLRWLDERGLRRGLLSRNSRQSIQRVLQRCGLHFDTIVAREDAPFKPNPHGIWQICEAWQVLPAEVLMVGDYLFDLQAGRNAGARTALVTHGRQPAFAHLADLTFSTFETLPDALEAWLGSGA